MWDWINLNAEKIAGGVLAVFGLLGVAWAKLSKMQAGVAISESQKEVYEQMKERMTAQEARLERHEQEIDQLRMQIRDRDFKIHTLELYIADLQHILHMHGIEVPAMRGHVAPNA